MYISFGVTFFKAGPGNTGPGNTGPGNTGPGNTGPGNTGPGNTGPGNTGPGNTGPGNTGPGNTGPGNTGPGNCNAVRWSSLCPHNNPLSRVFTIARNIVGKSHFLRGIFHLTFKVSDTKKGTSCLLLARVFKLYCLVLTAPCKKCIESLALKMDDY